MTLSEWKDVVTIAGTGLGLLAAAKGLIEYSEQNAQRRLQLFQDLRRRFEEKPAMQKMRAAIEAQGPNQLRAIAKNDKVDFAAFYEDVALMMNSGLIRPEVAHYWFGFYAVSADEDDAFWSDLNKELPYWRVFRQFARTMRQLDQSTGSHDQPRLYRV
jgi:hypothetical protein